jgi:5'-3' exonuclease
MHIRLIDAQALVCAQASGPGEPSRADLAVPLLQALRRWRHAEPEALPVLLWDTVSARRRALQPSWRDLRRLGRAQQPLARACAEHQMALAELLAHVPVAQVAHPDMEARDLAHALSRELSLQGHLVSLSTSDTAWLQCVRSRVTFEPLRKSAATVDEYTFKKQLGCHSPAVLAELRALTGVPADQVEGVTGMSEDLARALLARWGTLAAFWKAAEDPFFDQPELLAAALPQGRSQALHNKALLDLAAHAAPDLAQVRAGCGEFSDIDLYEALLDLEQGALCEGFALFARPFEVALTKEQVSLFARTVRAMPKAYAQGAAR